MISPKCPPKQVSELLIFGWEQGVKSFYYQRSANPSQELARSILQFKNFPLTFNYTHMARGIYRKTIKGKVVKKPNCAFVKPRSGTIKLEKLAINCLSTKFNKLSKVKKKSNL